MSSGGHAGEGREGCVGRGVRDRRDRGGSATGRTNTIKARSGRLKMTQSVYCEMTVPEGT